jgi:Transposase DDE domain
MTTTPEPSNPRWIKGLELVRRGSVAETSTAGEFVVASQEGKGLYRVTGIGIPGGFEACTCPDFNDRLAPCKHVWACRLWIEASNGDLGQKLAINFLSPARAKRIDWSVYNRAKTEEYFLVHRLLRELTASIPESAPNPKGGRPSVPLRDQAFSAIQKIYSLFPYRDSHGYRIEATARGELSRTPYWAVGSRYLCRPESTVDLDRLLMQSAIPLIAIERICAVDSTGLRTTRFNNYRREKYERQRENIWLKMHALVGIETHVICALEVTEGSAHDFPMFPVLLKKATGAGFRFDEVLADKGYHGRENYDAAVELGIEPYIPFKSNSTGHAGGSPTFHRMYNFFRYHRDKFDASYRQRAQVESTFGAFKQTLGETVASRTITSQINEIYCRAIAYNLTILVRQMFERNILPDFLQRGTKGLISPTIRQVAPVVPGPVVPGLVANLSVSKPDFAVSNPPGLEEV